MAFTQDWGIPAYSQYKASPAKWLLPTKFAEKLHTGPKCLGPTQRGLAAKTGEAAEDCCS